MTGPIDFNPFKNIGGAFQIGEMTDTRQSLNPPDMQINEPPAISMDIADEEGIVDITDTNFDFNMMDLNKKFPQ